MMRHWGAIAVAVVLRATAGHGTPPPVTLTAVQVHELGIVTAPLVTSTYNPVVARFGVATVLDSAPLLQLVDDKVAADAAAAASSADAARQAALFSSHQDVSQRAVEVAQAQAVADRARARTAASRFVVEWSPGLAHPSPALVEGLLSGRLRLLRIESLDNAAALRPGARIELTRSRSPVPIVATVIGSASGPSAVASGPAWLATVNAPMLHTLEPLDVVAPRTAASSSGVLVPTAAVVMIGGHNWLFRALPDHRFERIALPAGSVPISGGFHAPVGLAVGSHVVVRGAGALLSIEAAHSTAKSAGSD